MLVNTNKETGSPQSEARFPELDICPMQNCLKNQLYIYSEQVDQPYCPLADLFCGKILNGEVVNN